MQKKFITNLALLILLNIVVKPFTIFGIDASVQNIVGSQAYGVYFALLNISFLFSMVMDLGINNYTTKNLAQYPEIVSRYMRKVFSFRLLLFVIYACITFILALSLGYESSHLPMLLLLVFNQLLVTLIAYFRSHFSGLLLFKTDAIISVLDRLLLLLICGTFLLSPAYKSHFQIETYVIIQTVSYSITFLIAFFLLVSKIGFPRYQISWLYSLAILRKSYPYALLVLLMMLYTRTDSIMLERLHPNGAHESGVYAQGFRLLDAFFMFGMLFANLLLPLFSRLVKTNPLAISPLLITARSALFGGSLFSALLCYYHAETILGWIYTNAVAESVLPFQLLMWTFISMSLTLIYGTLLTARGDLRFLNQLALGGIGINIVLNSLLIGPYGAAGAAFATLITQSFVALIQLVYCHRSLPIQFASSHILQPLLLVVSMVICTAFFQESTWLLIAHLIVGTIGMFVFKLVDIVELRNSFRRET
jgi:O-antigen/teichoic acid export membrane protein